jgi:hypothetical protein
MTVDEVQVLVSELRRLVDEQPGLPDAVLQAATLLDGWEPVLCGECGVAAPAPVCRCAG